MPTVVLKATIAAAQAAAHQSPQSAGPLFRGNGDIDYLCGNCSFIIANAMQPTQRVPFDSTTCPACGATNEFPAVLRA